MSRLASMISVFIWPVLYWRDRPLRLLGFLLLTAGLTALTQFGGLYLWLAIPIVRFATRGSRGEPRQRSITFAKGLAILTGYLAMVIAVVPLLAGLGGKRPLPWLESSDFPIRPHSLLFPLLGRNYVSRDVYESVLGISRKFRVRHPDATVRYLDACFPFSDVFPLLPHISHRNGRQIDFGFVYRSGVSDANHSPGSPSPIGYFAYVAPKPGESTPCGTHTTTRRWNFTFLQPLFANSEIDPSTTRDLVLAFADDPSVKSVLIEQHLRDRLSAPGKVRFQGCGAARHDDHFHVQFVRR